MRRKPGTASMLRKTKTLSYPTSLGFLTSIQLAMEVYQNPQVPWHLTPAIPHYGMALVDVSNSFFKNLGITRQRLRCRL
jgi:hypothetical protein